MRNTIPLRYLSFVLALLLTAPVALADGEPIDSAEIAELAEQLAEAKTVTSSARQKLAIRRVIRSGESLLKKHSDAPNRFELLGVLFDAQQVQFQQDDSATNRRSLLETCRALVDAPDEYAAVRLDADLLLSQADLAKQGADQQARAEALKPLVQRYLGTDVQAKVVRIAMLMAIEMGDASLIGYLRSVIAEHMPGDLEMINFQRDQLAGQVFGAPFVGVFEGADGRTYRMPMDAMGTTTGLYFWTKEGDGIEQLKLLADGLAKVQADPELNAASRYQFFSFNLDGLPDAGESLLREVGLDWPALRLPGGEDNAVYKTYVRNTPKLLTMTPSGYTAMVMSGSTRVRPDRGWERSLQSRLARSWVKPRYTRQMQTLFGGELLMIDPTGTFDPVMPPELKAAIAAGSRDATPLARTDKSVPSEVLQAIQACFVKPPMRYKLSAEQTRANLTKAEKLSRVAIEAHPEANDLWIVRNRRIVALMGLWKLANDRRHYDAALVEARAALEAGYPEGADIIARFCLARESLRSEDADIDAVIHDFTFGDSDMPSSASSYALASLLALELGDRQLHERYRRLSLDDYANTQAAWPVTAMLMDRYHRYWLYHPPFTAGWTYGRRMGHFLAIGEPEDAERTLELTLNTLDGEAVNLPNASAGKWTLIHFVPNVQTTQSYTTRYTSFMQTRPFEDVNLVAAVFDQDANAVRAALDELKKPNDFPTMMVPDGLDNPIVQQLGILNEDERVNIVLARPDGTIAATLSGLTMTSQNGNAIQRLIEWHDEHAVDQAIERDDLEEAQRLAFAHAPPEQVKPEDAPRNWRPKVFTAPQLRARAKVYAALGEFERALEDAQAAYLLVNSKAGWLSMRTEDLEATERLRDDIKRNLEAKGGTQ
jgi:hypothetical protein